MSYRQPVPPETNPAVVKRAALINKDERGKFVELSRGDLGGLVPGYSGPPFRWFRWVQWNCSTSHANVFRGFHFQAAPHAQRKLVTLLAGRITDYFLDLRTGEVRSFDLLPFDQLYIPSCFAHAFYAHEPSVVVYACDYPRVVSAERAIHVYNLWPDAIRSPRDAAAPTFDQLDPRELP